MKKKHKLSNEILQQIAFTEKEKRLLERRIITTKQDLAEQRVVARLNEFLGVLQKRGRFQAKEFVDFMEPIFREYGWRHRVGKRPRILILRDDAAGDFVLFSPFLRECRRLYPQAEITLLVSPRNAGLAECCPYVDEIIINDTRFDVKDFAASFMAMVQFAVTHFLSRRYDLAFAGRLGIRSLSLIIMYAAGARERIGFSQDRMTPSGVVARLGWDCLLTVAAPFSEAYVSDVDRNLSLLETLVRLPIADRHIEVWMNEQHHRAARMCVQPLLAQGVKRIYVLVPAASIRMKQWPVARFIEVALTIARAEPDVGFAILGGPGDREAADACKAQLGNRCVALSGRISFLVSAAVIALSELYIGDDTGLMHVAAACGKPVLSVNCYPLSFHMMPMSVPVRFCPYQVPSVTVFPKEPKGDCADYWRHGCSHFNEAHCILGVSVQTMLDGYVALRQRMKEGVPRPLFLS